MVKGGHEIVEGKSREGHLTLTTTENMVQMKTFLDTLEILSKKIVYQIISYCIMKTLGFSQCSFFVT